MRLRRLDILGFKSFPERTQIHLVDGVTSIVGPNGCGKTNILDALRWVMGEQRPTLLRGGKMEDVIFNGSQTMKPHSMAEVSLSISNTRGVLPTEYNEIQITRRLFRSGESEYLLNRTPCRLRDIVDLFADTGMGANAYSVIQQHMIDALISDKTEDRRTLFEEAAGITKYKSRKRAALRKLEATDNDLQRLNDIVSEVKTRMNSLNRQMKKAERYRSASEQLKELDLSLAQATMRSLEAEASEKRLQLEQVRDRQSGAQTELDTYGASVEEDRRVLTEADGELSGLTRKIQSKTEDGHALERKISVFQERIEALKTNCERNQREIESCETRTEQLLGEEETVKKDLLVKESLIGEIISNIARAEQASTEADEQLLGARSSGESDTQKLLALQGRVSSSQSDAQNLTNQENELTLRQKSLSERIFESEKEISSASSRERETEELARSARERIKSLSAHITGHTEEVERLSQTLDNCGDEITELSARGEATEAKVLLLEEMIANHEGFGAGATSALNDQNSWPDLLGAIAELISPTEGYAPAIEAALDDVAGYLVTRNSDTAADIIELLRSEKKGKATVFMLDGFTAVGANNSETQRQPLSEPGFVAWADRLVKHDVELQSLAFTLLKDTAVFDQRIDSLSRDEVAKLLKRLPAGCQVVSSSGTLYRGITALSGGSPEGLPLFGRQEKVQQLKEDLSRLETELNGARQKKNETTATIARLRAEAGELEKELDTERENRGEHERLHSELNATLRSHERERDQLLKENKEAGEKIELLKGRQYTLSLDADQLADEKRRLTDSLAERNSRLATLEENVQSRLEVLNRLSLKLVEDKAQIQQLIDRIRHLQEIRQEVSVTWKSKISENEQARQNSEISSREIESFEKSLKTIFDERADITSEETKIRENRDQIGETLRKSESALREIRTRKDSEVENSHRLDLRLSQIESEVSSLLERALEEYGIDPRSYEAPAPPLSSDTDSKQNQDETKEAQLQTPEECAQARETISELRNKLKSYGPVNLLALEEHGDASERFNLLSSQLEDLTNARSTLQSTIAKINKTAKDMFNETFAIARKNFVEIFTELFDGGECDLRLADESDPLESDIVIVAKPKGKKLVTITQMSGGERALTAISLLFSLYLVKPSPFCILDEIDAPLDDANCHRFLRMIRRFSSQTQFITITHNKITMEAADTLYGVTMESPGISKLVAVRFKTDSDDGTARLTTEGAEEIDAALKAGMDSQTGDVSSSGSGNGSSNGSDADSTKKTVATPVTQTTPVSDDVDEMTESEAEVADEIDEHDEPIPQSVVERLTPRLSELSGMEKPMIADSAAVIDSPEGSQASDQSSADESSSDETDSPVVSEDSDKPDSQ